MPHPTAKLSTVCAPALLASAALAGAPDPWSLVVLPDTQFYCDSASRYPQFTDQTTWIVDNLAPRNIAFVSHIGDIVQNGLNGGNAVEWDRAVAALNMLHGLVPYAACIGNHDYNAVSDKGSGSSAYEARFGPARYAGLPWYGGASPNNQNHHQFFTAGNREYLHLALEWKPDAAALAWAQSIIDANPGLPTIISTHEHVQDGDANGNGAGRSGPGTITWNTLVRANPQIFMVVNGHFHRGTAGFDGEHHLHSFDELNLPVFEMLGDYQAWAGGGSGYLRIARYDERHGLIRVRTFTPTLGRYEMDANSRLDFPLDFNHRFNGTPSWQQQLTFLQSENGYTAAEDTQLSFATPDAPAAASTFVSVDALDGVPGGPTHSLVRFSNLFGYGAGQIAPNNDVLIAKLHLAVINGGSGLAVHRMLTPWTASSTWNSHAAGVSPDGVEALAAPDVLAGASHANALVPVGLLELDVTPSLRAWMNGAPNEGWALLPFSGGTNGIDFNSSEFSTALLRPTLVVTTTTAPVQTRIFREGFAAYAGAEDAELRQADPAAAFGDQPSFAIDSDDPPGTAGDTQVLLRFSNLFGTGPGQIPPDVRITSAVLTLTVTAEGSGFTLHRALADWSEAATWNSLASGVAADDADAEIYSTASGGANAATASLRPGLHYFDVTESLQAWLAGAPNRGWVLRPFLGGTDGVDIVSSEGSPIDARPTLLVRFQPLVPPPPCFGDADGDRDHDFEDVSTILALFGASGAPFRTGDATGDGLVNFTDVTSVLSTFGIPCP
jgi:hypothetical protein